MNTLEIDGVRVEPVAVLCTDNELIVTLRYGRKIVTPLWWFPRLLRATPKQRAAFELSPFGIHWEEIDEDLSIEGMLKGRKYPGAVPPAQAAAQRTR